MELTKLFNWSVRNKQGIYMQKNSTGVVYKHTIYVQDMYKTHTDCEYAPLRCLPHKTTGSLHAALLLLGCSQTGLAK